MGKSKLRPILCRLLVTAHQNQRVNLLNHQYQQPACLQRVFHRLNIKLIWNFEHWNGKKSVKGVKLSYWKSNNVKKKDLFSCELIEAKLSKLPRQEKNFIKLIKNQTIL